MTRQLFTKDAEWTRSIPSLLGAATRNGHQPAEAAKPG
jgi:hypothetical protein